mmetsp:Transcript_112787/g.350068  ORF Transcript_112787/g.350068 Transcript_112787/m.350068 type:complete len:200 (+) Transcript_112787:664-1263(+)
MQARSGSARATSSSLLGVGIKHAALTPPWPAARFHWLGQILPASPTSLTDRPDSWAEHWSSSSSCSWATFRVRLSITGTVPWACAFSSRPRASELIPNGSLLSRPSKPARSSDSVAFSSRAAACLATTSASATALANSSMLAFAADSNSAFIRFISSSLLGTWDSSSTLLCGTAADGAVAAAAVSQSSGAALLADTVLA